MKKIGLHLLALTGIIFATQAASAGLLLEPYLGYGMGNISATSKVGNVDAGGTTNGIGAGLRLGYKLPVMFWFAADYGMITGGKAKFSSQDYDAKGSDLWLDVGVDLPVLLRIWAGYGIQNTYDIDVNGTSDKYTGGSNMKLGLGFTFLPLVSLNLEYMMYSFADNEYGSVGNKSIDTYYKDHSQNNLLVSVSLPFNL